jgi:hypothetical protein
MAATLWFSDVIQYRSNEMESRYCVLMLCPLTDYRDDDHSSALKSYAFRKHFYVTVTYFNVFPNVASYFEKCYIMLYISWGLMHFGYGDMQLLQSHTLSHLCPHIKKLITHFQILGLFLNDYRFEEQWNGVTFIVFLKRTNFVVRISQWRHSSLRTMSFWKNLRQI